MKPKQVISLLLASQMLGAPLAQASILSPTHDAGQGYPRLTLQSRRTVADAVTNTAIPEKNVTTPAPTAEAVPGVFDEVTTPSPTPTAEAEVTTPSPTPTAEAEVTTPTPIPTAEAEAATPTPTPTAEAEVTTPTPIPTAEAEVTTPTPTPTAEVEVITPTPTPAPAESKVPTAVPEATPMPEETPVVNALEKTPLKALVQASSEAMAAAKASGTKRWAFNKAYIGFGYEVYRADQPSVDGRVKEARKYSEKGIAGDIHYADFAVEKPAGATGVVYNAASFYGDLYQADGYDGGIWGWPIDLDSVVTDGDGWPSSIGISNSCSAADIRIEYENDNGDYVDASLDDIAGWLGRIPDYKFGGWYASGLRPRAYGATLAELPMLTLWSDDYKKASYTHSYSPNVTGVLTKIPLAYFEGNDAANGQGADYPLAELATKSDYEYIRNNVVANYENSFSSSPYYDGTSPTIHEQDNDTYFMEVELPIIAHWELSNDATFVDDVLANNEDPGKRETIKTAIYSVKNGTVTTENVLKNLYDKPFTEPNPQKIPFDGKSSRTYYLCVNADIDAIAPQLIAAEPFRSDEAKEKGGVSIRFRAAGETTYTNYVETPGATDHELSHTLVNGSVNDGSTVKLYNNALCPLRSQWTVASTSGALGKISLAQATENATKDEIKDRYNELEITLTAPDGKTKNVYTIYIERLHDPYVVQDYGNTPYGMIARESADTWTSLAASQGGTAEDALQTTYDRFVSGVEDTHNGKPYSFNRYNYTTNSPQNPYFPRDGISNNSGVYEVNAVYDPRAWGSGDNVDLDKSALVVYQDSSFVDPGITVYDSEGRKVDLSEGMVKRSLTLRTAASGLRMSELTDTWGQNGYYAGKNYGDSDRMKTANADLWEESFQTVNDPDGKDRIDLRGLNVVPGIYKIEYRFTDALRKYTTVSGTEQNFDSKAGTLFVDGDLATTFTRTLVVLPIPGDVDMDGLVTVADAEALRRELASGGSFINGGSKVANLYYYRVCDVNYDAVVDGKDVSELMRRYIPNFKRNVACDKYFYIPLPSGMTNAEEEAWHKGEAWDGGTTAAAGKGALSLEYLGRHDDTIVDAATLAGISNKDSETGETVKLSKNDIFWVGVKVDLSGLTNAGAALKDGIAALKLAVAYDATYVEPAVLPGVAESGDKDSQWRKTLKDYNIFGSATNDPNLWPSTYELVESGCQLNTTCLSHYSRSTPVASADQNLSMLTVTLRDTAGLSGHRKLAGNSGSYLLRIPFTVKYVPPNAEYLEGLELSLSAQDVGALVEKSADVRPVVWSAQTEPVLGGVSVNLTDELSYVGGSALSLPLADQGLADATELVNTKNGGIAVYGGEFEYTNSTAIGFQDPEKINLPKGLTYNAVTGGISGTIQEAGTFVFAVTHNDNTAETFYIDVKKAPLKLYAVSQERYYGEPNGDLEFRYDPDDILPMDMPGGVNYGGSFQNDGTSEELSKLAGYKAPSLTTVVTQDTAVGTYDINIASADNGSGLSNYRFVYADVTLDADKAEKVSETTGDKGKSPLTIQPRPLVIGKITDAAVSSMQVNIDTAQTLFRNRTTSYQKDKTAAQQGFEPVLLSGNTSYPGYKDRLTGDAIYGTDEVTVTFNVRMTRENTVAPYYDLNGAASKTVDAAVESPALTATTDNANYELITLVDTEVHVTVTGNPIESVSMDGWSHYDNYSSGDILSFNHMRITVAYEKDNKTASTVYLGNDAALDPQFGHVYLTWVSADDKAAGKSHYDDADHLLKHGQELLSGVHNGKHLCVTVLQGSNPISWFSESTFEVLKRKITLTAKPLTVYYGEYKADMLDYTYDPRDLTASDLKALTDKLGHAPTGSSAELIVPGVEGLTNFVAPALSAWTGANKTSEEVSADTAVQWNGGTVKPSKIYIENKVDSDGTTVLSGASEYRFVFTGGPTGQERNYGVSDLNILPRPIMVDTVMMGENSKVFLYDDTTDWVLRQMYYTENGSPVAHPVTLTGRNTAAATAQDGADTFVAGAYNFSQRDGKDCYFVAGSFNPVLLEAPKPTGSAIHINKDGKMDEVVVTYVATYQRDLTSAVPPETSYFTMNGKAKKTVPVTVNGLALPKDLGDNSNYKLVYRLLRLATITSPEDEKTMGVVKLRSMKKVRVTADATKQVYTYGELMDLVGMRLQVTYESEGDNNLSQNMARNVIERTSYFNDTGDGSDSFAYQGLQVYWKLDPDLTVSTDVIEESALSGYLTQGKIVSTDVDSLGRYPDTAKTGKSLVVCGRRFDGDADNAAHELVWGEGSARFTINKKSLPLNVEARNRYYGEPIHTYQAYYALSDLSLPDQKALSAAGYTPDFTANGQGYFYISAEYDTVVNGREVSKNVICDLDLTDGVNDELGWLNQNYVAPGTRTDLGVRFTSTAVQNSDVGTYSVSMEQSSSGNMANYVFNSYEPERLRVFRRPIVIEKIKEKLPTIYFNTPETEFPALVVQGATVAADTGFRAGLPTLTGGNYDNSAKDQEIQAAVNAGMAAAMPLSGDAIYAGDELALHMTAVYPAYNDRVGFPVGKYQVDQPVTIKDLQLVDGYEKNYFLVYRSSNDEFYRQPLDPNATGQLDKRPINAISVLELPKMEYTYGQSLNLSRLKLKVTYGVISGETYPETDELYYSQLTGRLSVNYWDEQPLADGTFAPKPLPVTQADYGVGVQNRQARMGDHLTIAPAHDAGSIPGESTEFAHNRKYLILTARADADMNYDAPPILINNIGTPVPLTVKPLDLTYALTAGDRVYNDKNYATRTAASGTISLSNVYGTSRVETDLSGDSTTILDRDLIYVAADKTFDRAELASFVNDTYKTSADAYVFSVDGTDQTGRMAFNFYDENVMYYEGAYTEETPIAPEDWAGYWNSGLAQRSAKYPGGEGWNSYGEVAPMPVLVSGLKLLGPDAANYTLDEWVGRMDDVAAIFNAETANPAKAQVPYAVMNKASQSIDAAERPLLSVDEHSNTVRLTYETSLETVRPGLTDPTPDAFQSEYHYQYGLEYQGEESLETDIPTAMLQWGEWSDHNYFGGEKLEVSNDPNYVPVETPEPPKEDEVVKGQCYPWEAEDVDAVTGESLFGTRERLDRNTVYWGMVRLAESHNYLPSAPVRAYLEDKNDPTVAAAIVAEQRAAALESAEEISQAVLDWVQNKPQKEHPELLLGPAPAVKTYTQSIELISSEEKSGADSSRYNIDTLEAVWFTDVQKFARSEELSAVVRNLAEARYYNFYWDQGKSAPLEFGNDGLDLSQEEILVEVSEKQPDGSTARVTKQVNLGDDPENAPRPYSAVLYVSGTSGGDTTYPSGISIGGGGGLPTEDDSNELRYEVGSAPDTLKVTFKPAAAMKEGILWSTSDSRVVLVDENGKMLFVGIGSAEITATTRQTRKTHTVTVTVTAPDTKDVSTAWSAALSLVGREENRFDFYHTDAFMHLDGDGLFQPEWTVIRSELVLVLERLYQSKESWNWDGRSTFNDVSGREAYASAAERLYAGGILKGLPDGGFGAGKTATRAEVATILCRMMGLQPEAGSGASQFFEDCGVNYAWANGYIDALTKAGVIKGMDEIHFAPEREITRAELAAMLGRLLLTGVHYGSEPQVVPGDVGSDHWAYEVTLRAINQVIPREH